MVMDACAKVSPVAAVRTWRERAIQTAAYELGGLLVVSPLWALAVGATAMESITLLVVLSATVVCWTAAYNTVFDVVEARVAGRVASSRPHGWRIVHAAGLEASSALATWPLIVWLADLGWLEALVADFGLTLSYALYGYVFHVTFDRLRPVAQPVPRAG
jgi:uncharacterized membrane protein